MPTACAVPDIVVSIANESRLSISCFVRSIAMRPAFAESKQHNHYLLNTGLVYQSTRLTRKARNRYKQF